ncbi:putative leucine-rich repeat domain superfamily protein, partial [Tanacetum coccineum]
YRSIDIDIDDDSIVDRIIEFYSSVENILSQYGQSNINKFQLHASYTCETDVEICIRYAMDLNVREVDINVWDYSHCTGFVLPKFFFDSSSFIHLKLFECYFDDKCDVVICWKNLRSLSIANVRLHEDLIQNILSGSPLLETLVLKDCYGFERLDITNNNVKNLVISGELDEDYVDAIIINAPYILSLTIEDHVSLMKLLMLNVSSVIQAELDYSIKRHFQPEEMHKDQEMNEELLKGFILSLSHVKELKIGKLCSKVLACLKAKGFICPSTLKVLEEIDSN